MPSQAWVMLGILTLMFVLLIGDWLPAWLVFLGTLTATMTLKLESPEALLKGFSNTGVVTVAALFPVAAGMYATGAISLLSQRLIGLPKSVGSAEIKILPPVALGSAFLNKHTTGGHDDSGRAGPRTKHRTGRIETLYES